MALKVTLRRGERLFIGGSSIRNENQSTVLLVDGNDPVLREREMLSAETADTPAKKLVLALQHIYLSERFDELHELYIVFARELLAALPDAAPFIASIDESIASHDYFKALKESRDVVAFEAEKLGCRQAKVSVTMGKKRALLPMPNLAQSP